MKFYYLTIIAVILCFGKATAQDITPTDLFQIYKYWQVGGAELSKDAYDYIGTMDKHWSLRTQPQKDVNGASMFFGYYYGGEKWFKDGECNLMLTLDRHASKPKGLLYLFADKSTWDKYNKQMELMSAVKLGSRPYQGGNSTAYQVNDIGILLIEFPPGINGVDQTYEVQLYAL